MSKYCDVAGYTGTSYAQSVVWHYKTDIDRDVLNRWFVNIFDQGVCGRNIIPNQRKNIHKPKCKDCESGYDS